MKVGEEAAAHQAMPGSRPWQAWQMGVEAGVLEREEASCMRGLGDMHALNAAGGRRQP